MNDLTGMFDASMSLEERVETASYLLKEAAEAEGLDIEDLEPEEIDNLVTTMVNGGEEGGEGEGSSEGGGEEGGGEGEEGKTASDLTYADVALEVSKVAAAQGIDLTELDSETYSEIFDKVAEFLVNPELQKQAEEEQQKWAEQAEQMDALGRVAARGFVDEINKLAADDDDERKERKKDDDDDDEVDIKVKKAALKEKVKAIASGAKNFGGRAARAVGNAERAAHKQVGRATTLRDADSVKGHVSRGRKVTAGAAGTSAAVIGGKKLHDRSKKASYVEEAALEMARNTLLQNGIDPDTGTKIASDDEVSARAVEILQEAGYSL
jgi:hypothetical protein